MHAAEDGAITIVLASIIASGSIFHQNKSPGIGALLKGAAPKSQQGAGLRAKARHPSQRARTSRARTTEPARLGFFAETCGCQLNVRESTEAVCAVLKGAGLAGRRGRGGNRATEEARVIEDACAAASESPEAATVTVELASS